MNRAFKRLRIFIILLICGCGSNSEPISDSIALSVKNAPNALPSPTLDFSAAIMAAQATVVAPELLGAKLVEVELVEVEIVEVEPVEAAVIEEVLSEAATVETEIVEVELSEAAPVEERLINANAAPSRTPDNTETVSVISTGFGFTERDKSLLDTINLRRTQFGLHPLFPVPALNNAARRHSRDMATNGLTGHGGSDGSTAAQRIRAAGYVPELASEAIVFGFPTAVDAVEWLINDPYHRDQILSPQFTEFGVSYSESSVSDFRHFWVVTFGKR